MLPQGAGARSRMCDGALGRRLRHRTLLQPHLARARGEGSQRRYEARQRARRQSARLVASRHGSREPADRGAGAQIPEAARGTAGGIRPLGRRLRRGDAPGLRQLSRRPRRDGALYRGADHAHAAAPLEREDGRTRTALGRRRGHTRCASVRSACRTSKAGRSTRRSCICTSMRWRCRTTPRLPWPQPTRWPRCRPDVGPSQPHAGPHLCAVRRLREGEARERSRRCAPTTCFSPMPVRSPTTRWRAATTCI